MMNQNFSRIFTAPGTFTVGIRLQNSFYSLSASRSVSVYIPGTSNNMLCFIFEKASNDFIFLKDTQVFIGCNTHTPNTSFQVKCNVTLISNTCLFQLFVDYGDGLTLTYGFAGWDIYNTKLKQFALFV
jgi:hypothetical protein